MMTGRRALYPLALLILCASAQGCSNRPDTKEGASFARTAFTKVAKSWSLADLKSVANEEWGSEATMQGWLRLHNRTMGPLKNLSSWKTAKSIPDKTHTSAEQRVQVTGHATFTKGDCDIIVTVRKNGGKWTLSGYRIQSPAVRRAIEEAVGKAQ